MSSRNDEVQGMAIAWAFIGAGLFFLFSFIFTLFAFIALIFTVLSLFAWNKRRFSGEFAIDPPEARAFVWRGLAGLVVLPAFAAFSEMFLNYRIPEDFWFYIFVGGYVLGSVGTEILIQEEKEQQEKWGDVFPPLPPAMPQLPALPPPPAPPQPQAPALQYRPFEFASWDDEEDRP